MPLIRDRGRGIKDSINRAIRLHWTNNALPNLLVLYLLKDSGTTKTTTHFLTLSTILGNLGNFQKPFSIQMLLSNPCLQPVAWYYRPSFPDGTHPESIT